MVIFLQKNIASMPKWTSWNVHLVKQNMTNTGYLIRSSTVSGQCWDTCYMAGIANGLKICLIRNLLLMSSTLTTTFSRIVTLFLSKTTSRCKEDEENGFKDFLVSTPSQLYCEGTNDIVIRWCKCTDIHSYPDTV